jgi:hypothetical protein
MRAFELFRIGRRYIALAAACDNLFCSRQVANLSFS